MSRPRAIRVQAHGHRGRCSCWSCRSSRDRARAPRARRCHVGHVSVARRVRQIDRGRAASASASTNPCPSQLTRLDRGTGATRSRRVVELRPARRRPRRGSHDATRRSLAGLALLVSVLIGLPLGVLTGARPRSLFAGLVTVASLILVCCPPDHRHAGAPVLCGRPRAGSPSRRARWRCRRSRWRCRWPPCSNGCNRRRWPSHPLAGHRRRGRARHPALASRLAARRPSVAALGARRGRHRHRHAVQRIDRGRDDHVLAGPRPADARRAGRPRCLSRRGMRDGRRRVSGRRPIWSPMSSRRPPIHRWDTHDARRRVRRGRVASDRRAPHRDWHSSRWPRRSWRRTHPNEQFADRAYAPPTRIHLFDDGGLHAPFVHPLVLDDRLARRYHEDTSVRIPLALVFGRPISSPPPIRNSRCCCLARMRSGAMSFRALSSARGSRSASRSPACSARCCWAPASAVWPACPGGGRTMA